jgi:hypothetical protein
MNLNQESLRNQDDVSPSPIFCSYLSPPRPWTGAQKFVAHDVVADRHPAVRVYTIKRSNPFSHPPGGKAAGRDQRLRMKIRCQAASLCLAAILFAVDGAKVAAVRRRRGE